MTLGKGSSQVLFQPLFSWESRVKLRGSSGVHCWAQVNRRLKPDHGIWSLLPHLDKVLKASLLQFFFLPSICSTLAKNYNMLKCMSLSSTHSLIKKEEHWNHTLRARMSGPSCEFKTSTINMPQALMRKINI